MILDGEGALRWWKDGGVFIRVKSMLVDDSSIIGRNIYVDSPFFKNKIHSFMYKMYISKRYINI